MDTRFGPVVALVIVLSPVMAEAQQVADEPFLGSQLQSASETTGDAGPPLDWELRTDLVRQLKQAGRIQLAGSLVASLGAVGGSLVSLLGGVGWLGCEFFRVNPETMHCNGPKAVTIAGAAMFVASLSVGISVYFVGKRRAIKIQDRLRSLPETVAVVPTREGATFSVGWSF